MKMQYPVRSCAVAAFLLAVLALASCGPIQKLGVGSNPDFSEGAQQIGDVMASIDESGGSTGSYGFFNGSSRTFARLVPESLTDKMFKELIGVSSAYADTCANTLTFGSCLASTITRTFGGCTVGPAVITGNITLNFSNALCQLPNVNDSVSRAPNFTVTGLRGATLTVTKAGAVGQNITRIAASPAMFSLTNDGIRRKFTTSTGVVPFDFTTQTTSAMTITGALRSGRVVNGGILRVTNNVTGTTCDYVPSAVTWGSSCTCATSGSWSATCSDGKTSSVILTGCGTAKVTLGTLSGTMVFDRCY